MLWAPCCRRQLSGAAELNFQTVALECGEHARRLGLLALKLVRPQHPELVEGSLLEQQRSRYQRVHVAHRTDNGPSMMR